ncbi:HIT domain-containing protein [soil metagenome]
MESEETSDFYCDYVFTGLVSIRIVRETARVLAFHHTKPGYPFHIVIVPKQHISTLLEVEDFSIGQEIFELARSIVEEFKLQETNYRIVTNGGSYQDSKHLHFHLISTATEFGPNN